MLLALFHPLVQAYTIPTTGELAYVGHVCNFRQKVSKFLSSIPAQKQSFPAMVVVRPRQAHGQGSNRLPFPVDVKRLHAAYLWLKVHNPYYKKVDWDEPAAVSWEDTSIELPTKEYDTSESVCMFRGEFCMWMETVTAQHAAGIEGFQLGGACKYISLGQHRSLHVPVSMHHTDQLLAVPMQRKSHGTHCLQ